MPRAPVRGDPHGRDLGPRAPVGAGVRPRGPGDAEGASRRSWSRTKRRSSARSRNPLYGPERSGLSAIAEASDAYVYFPGPEQFPRLLGLSAEELDAVLGRHGAGWWRAARRARLRAARIAVAAATAPAAARFGVDRDAWQRELIQGSLVAPERLARAAAHMVRRLHRARQVRLRHPNGTDLAVELLRARPVVEDGRVERADRRAGRLWTQIPTGVVAVPLVPGVAEGVWESNRETYQPVRRPHRSVARSEVLVPTWAAHGVFVRPGRCGVLARVTRGGRMTNFPGR